jgi:hypothetical protein
MKKFGILLGFTLLGMVAVAQMAVNNTVVIKQIGIINTVATTQTGSFNYGNVSQMGIDNGAVLTQKYFANVGVIKQFGIGNYANLQQEGLATGYIFQMGMKNLAVVKQMAFSNAIIEQLGNGNIAAGARVHFMGCKPPRAYFDGFSRCDLAIPRPFSPIVLGFFDKFTLKQTGTHNVFLAMGPLNGTQDIKQVGKDNTIVLGQSGWFSSSYLRQYGVKNYIWLNLTGDNASIVQSGYKNLTALNQKDGDSHILQVGAYNKIGYWSKSFCCSECPSAPATFAGDDLNITQMGLANQVSLYSTTKGNTDVTISQYGVGNWARVVQTAVHEQLPHDGCGGCGQR